MDIVDWVALLVVVAISVAIVISTLVAVVLS